jgi:O-antigen ligase
MEGLIASLAAPVAALVAAVALPFLVWHTYATVTVGLVLVLATFFLEVLFVEFPGLQLGIYLYPGDIVFSFLAIPAFLRLVFASEFPGRSLPWLLFGALLGASFAVGLGAFGRTAGTEFRPFFYLWVCTLYFMSFPFDEARAERIFRVFLGFATLILILAVLRWLAEAAGLPIADTWRGKESAAAFRVVPSGATLVLVNALLVVGLMLIRDPQRVWLWAAALAFGGAVILLQHRSVWIAGTIGVLTLVLVFRKRIRIELLRQFGVGLVLVLFMGVGLVGYGKLDQVISSLSSSAVSVTDTRGTAGGRIYGWQQLLMQVRPSEYITGKPFGSGYERYDYPGVRWKATYDPHNFYLQTMLRTGLPGLALFLLAYVLFMPRLWRSSAEAEASRWPPRLLFALIAAQLAFMVPYQLPYEQGIWIGLAIAAAAGLRRAKSEVPGRSRKASGGSHLSTA